MNINSKRILALVNLGLHIKNYSYNDPKYSKLDNCIEKSIILNKWFTRGSITNALKSWAYTLESKNIEKSPNYNILLCSFVFICVHFVFICVHFVFICVHRP